MRFFFAISACTWAYIVGRCIAFGVYFKGITWKARLTTSTWYRLTPILYKMPHWVVPYIPIIFTLCKAYSLALDDNTIHILGVLLLTSAHRPFPHFYYTNSFKISYYLLDRCKYYRKYFLCYITQCY